jgi:hypothetical protein
MATATENSRKALQTYMPEALVAGGNVINKNPLAAGGIGNVLGDVSLTKFEAGRLPIMQQTANAASANALTNQGRLAELPQLITKSSCLYLYLLSGPGLILFAFNFSARSLEPSESSECGETYTFILFLFPLEELQGNP